MGRCATETDDAKGLYEMSLEVFDNYECDGQIEISDLKGEEMEKLIYIPAEQIHEHPDNPRKNLGDLEELSESIRKKGIMQNLTVMIGHWDEKGKWQQDGYTLLIGHRRFAAGKMAAVSEFPCRVIEKIDYKDQIGIMMEENMQRNDLTIWEEANGFQMMLDLGDTEEQIAEKTGFSKSTIKHRLNIAKLDQDVLKEKEQNDGYQLTLKGLYELEKITDIDKRNEILRQSGSSVDLVARARSAVVSERREKVKRKIISALEASGAKKMSDKDEMSVWDSGKWKKIQEYKTDNDLGEIDVSESDEQLYWRTIWSGIEVYKKKKQVKKKETKAERLEKERKAKQKQIKEVMKKMDARRKEFIRDIISGKIDPVKNEQRLKDSIWMILVAVGSGVYRSTMSQIFLEKDRWEHSQEERDAALKKVDELNVIHQMLIVLHDEMNADFKEVCDYMCRYKKGNGQIRLEAYRILELYGWYFEPGEKEILDGTSELYEGEADE